MLVSEKQREKQLLHRNEVAALMSIIPGLGHLYKGHTMTGLGLLIISPFFIWAALLFGFATAGLGLLLPLAYIFIVAWGAYNIDDKRKHHIGLI